MAKTKFREWAKANNLTAAQIAERIGCSPRTVYAYFVGERLPNRNRLSKTCPFGYVSKL